jgi:cytochrome c
MLFWVGDNFRIATQARTDGRLARPERQPCAQGKETKMKFRYATFVAAIAFIVPAASALADGDPAAGEVVFKQKCAVCHKVGEGAKTLVGPTLNGIVGRHSGSIEGFNYSEANKNSGLTWDAATLQTYLTNPKALVPGTKMIFPGLPNETDRANVIAYLGTFNTDGTKK